MDLGSHSSISLYSSGGEGIYQGKKGTTGSTCRHRWGPWGAGKAGEGDWKLIENSPGRPPLPGHLQTCQFNSESDGRAKVPASYPSSIPY